MCFIKNCYFSMVNYLLRQKLYLLNLSLKEESDVMNENRSNNTRQERKNGANSKLEKIYYIVIGVLVLILLSLVIFIFANRGNGTDEISENPTPGSEEVATDTDEQEPEEEIEPGDDATEEEEETTDDVDSEEEETDTEDSETDQDEEDTEEDDQESEEEYDVVDDAPHDSDYVPDYSDGSSDRNAIAQAASSVTGISQGDMTTWWVGNDGPGRVQTTISDSDQSDVYTVYLQYGDGQWHVTNVQELSSVPSELQ